MKKINRQYLLVFLAPLFLAANSSKNDSTPVLPPPPPSVLVFTGVKLDNTGALTAAINYNVSPGVSIRLSFNNAVDRSTVSTSMSLKENGSANVGVHYSCEKNDSIIIITPSAALNYLKRCVAPATSSLKSVKGGTLLAQANVTIITQIDSTDKFPLVSDNALLDLVQQQTFNYFWDYGHPVSGLARERSNATPETVTTGGSGFGIMGIQVADSSDDEKLSYRADLEFIHELPGNKNRIKEIRIHQPLYKINDD